MAVYMESCPHCGRQSFEVADARKCPWCYRSPLPKKIPAWMWGIVVTALTTALIVALY